MTHSNTFALAVIQQAQNN